MPIPSIDSIVVSPASQVVARPVEWLWPGRLAFGKLSIFDGDPELGKSMVALDLCARLSTGRPFPDGSPSPGILPSIYLNAEDGPEDTIVARLRALGADLERVFVLNCKQQLLNSQLSFPAHLDFLNRALADTGARYLVVDPIVAFLDPSVLYGSDQSIRRALYPLSLLADRHRCASTMVRHLNKKPAAPALYRGGGSIGFLAACRSGWLFARQPRDPFAPPPAAGAAAVKRCVMAQLKNNLASLQPSLAYELSARDNSVELSWLGPCQLTADQLLARPYKTFLPGNKLAQEFLNAFLADGPRTTRDIWDAAQEFNLLPYTLQRVRKVLEIRSKTKWREGAKLTYWLLRNQTLPGADPVDPESDLEPWLAPLRKQYPTTPLDDDV
ncbi:MAG: AAA family ATPase [Planctomycetes bacterium]|nr:AAA family ATPase [Planctomycetota bacterium]